MSDPPAGAPAPLGEGKWDGRQLGRPFVLPLDGTYWMFYAGSDLWGEWKIGAALSVDGINWDRLSDEPLLVPPATRLSGGGWHSYENPWVRIAGGGFRLFASATGDRPGSAIVSLYSPDGDTWSEPVIEIVAPDSDEGVVHLRDPWIVSDQRRENLFVTRVLTKPRERETRIVRYFRALSGRWTETDTAIADPDGGEISHAAVLRVDDRWTLWCSSFVEGRFRILVAHSTDLHSWSTPTEALGGDPSSPYETQGVFGPMIVKDDSGFLMWHLTSSRTSDGMSIVIRLRRSNDGETWSLVADRPVFTPRPGVPVRPW